MAELYAGAIKQGFSVNRANYRGGPSVRLACYRAHSFYIARDRQSCPYSLTVGKVGGDWSITQSDLRHNHTLPTVKDNTPSSLRPVPATISFVIGSIGSSPYSQKEDYRKMEDAQNLVGNQSNLSIASRLKKRAQPEAFITNGKGDDDDAIQQPASIRRRLDEPSLHDNVERPPILPNST
jgi:hypothetical protein